MDVSLFALIVMVKVIGKIYQSLLPSARGDPMITRRFATRGFAAVPG